MREMTRRSCLALMATTAAAPAARALDTPIEDTPIENRPIELPALLNDFHQIWIPARMNDSPVLWCELDSGAGGAVYLIDARMAASIGIRAERVGQSAGVIQGQPIADGRARVTVEFPGLRLEKQELIIKPAPLDKDGIVGLFNFRQWVAELDYQTPTVRLHDAKGFQGKSESVPISIEQTNPMAEVRLTLRAGEEIRGRFVVDTGAAGSLAYLSYSFADRLHLADRGLRWVADSMGNRAARIARLSVGPYGVDQAVIRVFPARGFGGTVEPDGMLGVDFLRRFRVFFDYGRERLVLEPNAFYSAPDRFDASGIRIYKDAVERRGLSVFLVVPGTPAAEAGVKEGDRLLAVDGAPVDLMSAGRVSELLMEEGAERSLLLQRGPAVLIVRLKLRRLL
jgi:PDZ domain/Aspartyl protease